MPRARKPGTGDLRSGQYGELAGLLQTEQEAQQFVGPDEVPNMSDPTARPEEPVTTGLPTGDGAGPEVMQPLGADPVRRTLQAMLLFDPDNNDVMRLIDMLDSMGR